MDLAKISRYTVRATHWSSATRLKGQAGPLIEATPVDADELALMQTNLSTKLTTLEALNTEIVELTPCRKPIENNMNSELFELYWPS